MLQQVLFSHEEQRAMRNGARKRRQSAQLPPDVVALATPQRRYSVTASGYLIDAGVRWDAEDWALLMLRRGVPVRAIVEDLAGEAEVTI